jgi:uncharacterized RDD family membrane protein YckC
MFTVLGNDGKEYGPAPVSQIKAWMSAGRADLDTKAKRVGEEAWQRIGDLPEFSERPAPPPMPGVPPTPVDATVLASRGRRLVSFAIDMALVTLCMIPFVLAFPHDLTPDQLSPDSLAAIARSHPSLLAGIRVTVCALLIRTVIQIWLLSARGQTVGKLLTGIRIVRFIDGGPPGFTRAWLARSFFAQFAVPQFLNLVPLLGACYLLVDYSFVFRADRRCLHDLVAGTKVVRD